MRAALVLVIYCINLPISISFADSCRHTSLFAPKSFSPALSIAHASLTAGQTSSEISPLYMTSVHKSPNLGKPRNAFTETLREPW